MGQRRPSSSNPDPPAAKRRLKRNPNEELPVTRQEFAALQVQVQTLSEEVARMAQTQAATMVTQEQSMAQTATMVTQEQSMAQTATTATAPPHTPQLEQSPLELVESDVISLAVSETNQLRDPLPEMSPPPKGTAAPPPPHCKTEPSPTESLPSGCNHGDQSTLRTPEMVKLEDCRETLGLNIKLEVEEEKEKMDGYRWMDGMPPEVLKEDRDEVTRDFIHPKMPSEEDEEEMEDFTHSTPRSDAPMEEEEERHPGKVVKLLPLAPATFWLFNAANCTKAVLPGPPVALALQCAAPLRGPLPPYAAPRVHTKRAYTRTVPANTCKKCGRFRIQETGHSQYKGKIYCPQTETLAKDQWLEVMRKK